MSENTPHKQQRRGQRRNCFQQRNLCEELSFVITLGGWLDFDRVNVRGLPSRHEDQVSHGPEWQAVH